MSIHNGARFISEQIGSIAAQTHSNWSLHISDDNSSDGSNIIIKGFVKQNQKERFQCLYDIRSTYCIANKKN
jgi:rhamnosyltransferase